MANFYTSGPSYLKVVDWSNEHHRRVILASLVNGVYTLESDRRHFPNQAQAAPWWEFFNFRLIQTLKDDKDCTYFGAIFEFDLWTQDSNSPRYVIAFRGTVIKPHSMLQDLRLDSACGINELHRSSRVSVGLNATRMMVMKNMQLDAGKVWLAGHSLGAAIALHVGSHMVRDTGIYLQTYLFNPPFVSLPITLIPNEKIRKLVRASRNLAMASLALFINPEVEEDDKFVALSKWLPHVFVNGKDPVCLGYIGYFEDMRRMEGIGAGKLVTKYCLRKFIWKAIGREEEAAHLIPSAKLIINSKDGDKLQQVHTIKQWWELELPLESKLCSYVR